MVNENFNKFREVQKKHPGVYFGGNEPNGNEKSNNQGETDLSPGTTGSKLKR